jgi:hypothetical protein
MTPQHCAQDPPPVSPAGWRAVLSFRRVTVEAVTRIEQQPNKHWREVYDHIPDRCRTCSKPLAAPNITLGTSVCPHHGPTRDFTCLACRTVHLDCPCGSAGAQPLGTQYFGTPHRQ